jgi:phosphotransferase system enzyme I (PtsI)
MAGHLTMHRFMNGLGLRSYTMHPSQDLAVKQQILRSDTGKLQAWAEKILASDDPAQLMG